MKYKLTENGNIVVKDGKPVVIDDNGKEFTVDALGASEKVKQAKDEAKQYRLDLKKAEDNLKKFEGIEDPKAALEALTTIGSLSDQHKLDIDKLKTQMNDAWEAKVSERDGKITELEDKLYNATVTSKFATSPIVKKLILPPDIAATYFGKHFQKDGTAKDSAGNTIYSKEKPGEPAEFDEALDILIDTYPNKESILAGSGAHGAGTGDLDKGGSGGGDKSSHDLISAGLKARGIA